MKSLKAIAQNHRENIPSAFRTIALEYIAYAETYLSEADREAEDIPANKWKSAINAAARKLPLNHNAALKEIKTVAAKRLNKPHILTNQLERENALRKLEEAQAEAEAVLAKENGEQSREYYAGLGEQARETARQAWERNWDAEEEAAKKLIIELHSKCDPSDRVHTSKVNHAIAALTRIRILKELAPVAKPSATKP